MDRLDRLVLVAGCRRKLSALANGHTSWPGLRVRDLMSTDFRAISPDMSLDELSTKSCGQDDDVLSPSTATACLV